MSVKEERSGVSSIQMENVTPKLEYLRELSGGDNEFIAEILEMFIKEAPQTIALAYSCLNEKNFELLRINVHKLKSSVQVVGGQHLTGLIIQIESWVQDDGEEVLPHMLSSLDFGIQQMVSHLERELKSLTTGSTT